MPEAVETSHTEVAIIGAGIGGLCLAIGLLQDPTINVKVYESASKLAEVGAGIGLGPNSMRAMAAISPKLEEIYKRINTPNFSPEHAYSFLIFKFGEGPYADQKICSAENETGQQSFHRAEMLRELGALLPEGMIEFNKRLHSIDESSGKPQLVFEDGEKASADCIVGADGIHSPTRRHILGEGWQKYEPQYAGSAIIRGLVPMAKARAELGDEIALNSHIHIGYGKSVTSFPIDHGETLYIAAADRNVPEWEGPWSRKSDGMRMSRVFASSSPLVRKMVELIDGPDMWELSAWDLPSIPTYVRGNICVLGDAAHATTPNQGAGAGQAIEDAHVLQVLLRSVKSASQIGSALKAYDTVRRPRSQTVSKTSREAGEIYSLRAPHCGQDPKKIRDDLESRWEWLFNWDVTGDARRAKALLERYEGSR